MLAAIHQIQQHLNHRARRVVVVAHRNPDGDALGTAAALIIYLQQLNLTPVLWCKTPGSSAFSFLAPLAELRCDPIVWTKEQFDTVVVVDTGDAERGALPETLPLLHRRPTIINIDHHQTNTLFGDINLVLPQAAATAEVIYSYFKKISHPINPPLATALLTGLLTDTMNFSNGATSEQALQIGAELIQLGAEYQTILKNTLQNRSFSGLKLWGLALTRLCVRTDIGLVYTAITKNDMQETGATDNDVEGLPNLLGSLSAAKISLVLRELPDGKVRGNLRTTHKEIDVSLLAQALGGGGHRQAAGFTLSGHLQERNGEWLIIDN